MPRISGVQGRGVNIEEVVGLKREGRARKLRERTKQ